MSSYDHKIEHYRVIKRENMVTVDDEEFFENLFKLVEVSVYWQSLVTGVGCSVHYQCECVYC